MTAFAAIALDDAASAAVTFSPSAIDSAGVAKLYDNAAASIEERRSISLAVRAPKASGSVFRVTGKVSIPVVDGSTPPLKVGEVIANIEFVIPKRAATTQRQDALAFAANFLADASFIAAVTSLEAIY